MTKPARSRQTAAGEAAEPTGQTATVRLPLRELGAALGVSSRTMARYASQGVIVPVEPSRGSNPALYDALVRVPVERERPDRSIVNTGIGAT